MWCTAYTYYSTVYGQLFLKFGKNIDFTYPFNPLQFVLLSDEFPTIYVSNKNTRFYRGTGKS
jgi:hypothetical protein